MRVALVCDWLTNVGGAEKVLLQLHRMYPEAPIYTSQYNPRGIDWFRDADVRVGWMRIFPCAWRRFLGVLRALYFSHLDLSEYDVVISVTGAEGKMVKTGGAGDTDGTDGADDADDAGGAKKRSQKRQQKHKRHGGHSNDSTDGGKSQALHISYCHVPTQYYWQMYDEYVTNPGFGVLNPLVRVCFKLLVGPLRRKDYEAAQRVDQFVTISEYAAGLISKYYQREAVVVHPPVEVGAFGNRNGTSRGREEYYITTSRQVTWKRLDLAVEACAKTGRNLLVVGEGPEHGRLVKLAEEVSDGVGCVKFLPLMEKEELAECLAGARGYLFPSLEPFGIAPVEALAAGCPVIAYGEGGALDYIRDGENGVLFSQQNVASLIEAMERFEKMKFDRAKVAKSAEGFSTERFEKEMKEVVKDVVETE